MTKVKSNKIRCMAGDIFLIPSSRKGFYIGQIALDTKSEIGAFFCYLYERTVLFDDRESCEGIDLKASDIISASLITPELIENKQWKVCANKPVPEHRAMEQIDDLRERGFVGATITGAGLIADYLDTFYGVISTSVWPDPRYVFSFFLRPSMLSEERYR